MDSSVCILAGVYIFIHSDSQRMEEELEEAHSQAKALESGKLEFEYMVRDVRVQLEEGRREKETLVSNGIKTSMDLKAKNLELTKLKEVRVYCTRCFRIECMWTH